MLDRRGEGGWGLINFLPLKRGDLLEGGGLFDRGIERLKSFEIVTTFR